ncbi:MAG: hypothetical protein IJO49_02135, partial [Clostridia bacterium]|nr:hypothetical protein [Clostridia bacterium]
MNKNPTKSSRFAVKDFEKSVFLFNQGKNAVNTVVLASILTMSERKNTFSKRCSSLIAHPRGIIN